MRKLADIRVDIDRIDEQIKNLLMERLDCSAEVVSSKIEDKNYVINRPERESAMLERLGADIPEERRAGYLAVVRKITETSRMYQYGRLFEQVPSLFAAVAEGINLKKASTLVTVRMQRPDVPDSMSAILSMIGDYGFDMEQLRLLGYSENHTMASFELVIRGDISQVQMQKLLLQLSMESVGFEIVSVE